MDDGRRDQTLLLLQDPFRVEIVLRFIPGVVQISDIRGVVAATHAARPDDRRRTHTAIWIHRVAMMSPMRGQSGRSRESEDSKTDKNAFGHSQLLWDIPPEASVNCSITGTPRGIGWLQRREQRRLACSWRSAYNYLP
jgi:hypothetical protein